jgi:hypothetical protein
MLARLDERRLLEWEEAFLDATLCIAEKGGSAVGKTRRGKGTKCMAVIDGQGIPIGAQLASAQISEFRLAESTLARVRMPRCGSGRPRKRLCRVIADRGYDSDGLRQRWLDRGTDGSRPTCAPDNAAAFEGKRKLRPETLEGRANQCMAAELPPCPGLL